MTELFQTLLTTNESALIAYVDLVGTKALYLDSAVSIKKKAKIIYDGLLNSFLDAFKNSFTEKEIQEHFYTNIYGDSILISLRITDRDAPKKLLHFLMELQRSLAFGAETDGISIPSRSILANGEFFSIHITTPSKEMFNPELTSIAICGGKGMVELDKNLGGLPIGVYVSPEVMSTIKSELYKETVKVKGEKLLFVKQPDDFIIASLNLEGRKKFIVNGLLKSNSLRDVIKNGLEKGGVQNPFKKKDIRDKWYPWIEAHTEGVKSIERSRKRK